MEKKSLRNEDPWPSRLSLTEKIGLSDSSQWIPFCKLQAVVKQFPPVCQKLLTCSGNKMLYLLYSYNVRQIKLCSGDNITVWAPRARERILTNSVRRIPYEILISLHARPAPIPTSLQLLMCPVFYYTVTKFLHDTWVFWLGTSTFAAIAWHSPVAECCICHAGRPSNRKKIRFTSLQCRCWCPSYTLPRRRRDVYQEVPQKLIDFHTRKASMKKSQQEAIRSRRKPWCRPKPCGDRTLYLYFACLFCLLCVLLDDNWFQMVSTFNAAMELSFGVHEKAHLDISRWLYKIGDSPKAEVWRPFPILPDEVLLSKTNERMT